MKIKSGFVLRKIEEDYIVVSVGSRVKEFNGVINLNEPSAMLWQLLETGATEEQLVNKLLEVYNVEKAVAEKDVSAFINKLTINGILE
jgi:hypothetical protein